ncbi:MAG: hypothetical protein ACXVJL_13860 [Candidatus Angelobacter sp.]
MGFLAGLFSKKGGPDELMDTSAKICEDALVGAAKKTLDTTKGDLAQFLSSVLPGISAVLASNLAIEVVNGVLNLLISRKHASEVERSLKKLLANPMRTGTDQLRIALQLESQDHVPTAEEKGYRADRFRDALRSFDQALSNASDAEKGPIHLYRAMTSLRIPGGEPEATIHLSRFSDSCKSRAELLEMEAATEESRAKSDAQEAEGVKGGSAGLGGGFVGMDQSQMVLKKRALEQSAAEHQQKARHLKESAQRLRNCIVTAEFLCKSGPLAKSSSSS